MADRRVRRWAAAAAVLAALSACGNASPTSTTPATTEPANTVVYQVTVTAHAGPTCPVERPGQSCPDVPVRGTVTLRAGGVAIASGETDADGRWVGWVEPATFEVSVDTGAALPRCEPVAVDVVDRNVTVDVSCDTGIR